MTTPPSQAPLTWSTPSLARLVLAFAALGLAGYGFTIGDFFLSDDFASLLRASRAGHWTEASTAGEGFSSSWLRPLPMWTWYWNYQWFETDPFGYRAFNLLVHIVNAVLLAWLVEVLVRSRWAGWFAGAAFTLFPNHPDAVTWICGRYDLLCTTGALACLLAWTRYLCPGGRGWHLGLAGVAAVAALASKEMAVSLPLLQLAIAVLFFRPLPRRARAGLLALAILVLAYLGIRFLVFGGVGGMTVSGESLNTTVVQGRVRFLRRALAGAFTPANRELFPSPWHPLKLLPLLALAPAFLHSQYALGARRCWAVTGAFGVLFLLSLAPVAGWAHLYPNNHNARYLYLPTAFSCAALATSFRFVTALSWKLGAGLASLALATWLTGLVLENRNWHEAARRAEVMVRTLPQEGPVTEEPLIRVTGIPDNHHGAALFRNGFAVAIRLCTEPKSRVRVFDEPEWARLRDEAAPDDQHVYYRWDGSSETWRGDERGQTDQR